MTKEYEQGYNFQRNNPDKSIHSNPYVITRSIQYQEWYRGYRDAKRSNRGTKFEDIMGIPEDYNKDWE